MEYMEGNISGVKDQVEFSYLIKYTNKFYIIYMYMPENEKQLW